MAVSAIAPQSTASTSSSSKKPCYDVFINHRGKDVKHTLAKSIYNMLVQKGVQTFLDEDELQLGDSFPAAIDEAMRSASVHVAIFSPKYAESVWCLEELSLMVKLNVTIIPLFYDVDPCHLRYVQEGKGIYADAFLLHQKKRQTDESPRYNPENIKEWMEALNCVSYKTGCILSADTRDQGELLKKIVDSALEKMKKVSLDVATYPVGIDVALENFEREVGSSSGSQNVYIVGICGMGGIGKTTLAKAIFNSKLSSMSRSSFLFDVRETSSRNSLHKLQAKLFKDLKIQDLELHHTDEGKEILKGLRPMTMLIVLDDVDNVEQMHCLMPPKDKLGQGSFIIVTTRDEGILTSWGISCIYRMEPFDFFNAKELFCRHAFSHPYSEIEYEHVVENNANFQDLIERFVKACNGLPLSLKVLGAMVNKQSKEFWEAQLHKIFRMLPNEIAERLKLSYDALDLEDQQMFLDIACFFIGGKTSLVVHIWDGGEAGWETLVQKCLVGLNENGNIEMHDHLRDLGREIAREVSPFRIWNKEQSSTLGGRTPIRGIVTATTLPWLEDEYVLYSDNYPLPLEHCMENFIRSPSLPGLKFLAVGGNDYRKEFAALSRGLVWLRWCDFNGSSLPSWLSLADLRVLELYNARNLEKLWQDNVQAYQSQLDVLRI